MVKCLHPGGGFHKPTDIDRTLQHPAPGQTSEDQGIKMQNSSSPGDLRSGAQSGGTSYTKCDCGSGLKYKFCCQKAEHLMSRIDRQIESKQIQAAVATIEEGLKKFPDTPNLILRRAMVHTLMGEGSQASQILEAFLAKHPLHPGVRQLLVLNALENDGPDAAAIELQRCVGRLDAEAKAFMANLPGEIGAAFEQEGKPLAAIAHALLSVIWSNGRSDTIQRLTSIQQNPQFSPWLRTHLDLAKPTEKVAAELQPGFETAFELAMNDNWLDAAEAYGKLAEKDTTGLALRNQGVCLAWLGDNAGAVLCLRASLKFVGESVESVDLEALCQELDLPAEEDLVDYIQLTWPVRSSDSLIENLAKSDYFINFNQENAQPATKGRQFLVLDRAKVLKPEDLRTDNAPSLIGEVLVEEKSASLIAPDDGRLDKITEQFRDVAAAAIVPAHPRTKLIGKQPKQDILRQTRWVLPEGMTPEQSAEFRASVFAKNLADIWPQQAQTYLDGKSPTQAAAAGHFAVPLRAAFQRMGWDRATDAETQAIAAMRQRLGVNAEPAPSADAIETLHPSRLGLVDVKQLDVKQLQLLFQKALSFLDVAAMEKSGQDWVSRPIENEEEGKSRIRVYMELGAIATGRNDLPKALELYAQGRKADTYTSPDVAEVRWSLAEIRSKSRLLKPEQWVPELAVLMDRKRPGRDAEAVTQTLVMGLVEMGLIRVVRDPQQPTQAALDTRILEALLAQFGPKITTASGELGVSAAKPQIWTPGQPGGGPAQGGGKIWTPGTGGQPPKAGGDTGSKLIVPGR